MDTHISEKSERFIREQLQTGRYRTEDEVVEEAIRLLEAQERRESEAGGGFSGDPQAAALDEDLQRRLQSLGLLSEIKPPIRDLEAYRGRRAVPIQGEPLSETVIRERR